MPVLYGVLMYMGVNTLRGMQFIDRLALMLMPTRWSLRNMMLMPTMRNTPTYLDLILPNRHQPDHAYLRHVPLYKA